ncbi:MAG: DUF2167 domain-containing protein [Muribaculaceae bacterium]|nr:DUF2167 domain-containing protein [Muribaculaceae bacterium]
MRYLIICFIFYLYVVPVSAQDSDLTPEQLEIIEQIQADSIQGRTGIIPIDLANCTITVPTGYIFLDKDASEHLLIDYWNNPSEAVEGIIGTLVKKDADIFYNVETAYVISYENAGYVSDKDASSINYDELLKRMQEEIKEENKKSPYDQKWELLGWAWPPAYDNQKKVLSWAKLYRIIGEGDVINYDVRVLGKAGFVVITAVASPDAKKQLLDDNSAIIGSVRYNSGFRYSDFNPATDHVAEWTIGGLIAGKVLAKAGVWAMLAKFSKVIIIAVIGFFAVMRKRFARWIGYRREDDDNS